MGFYKKNNVKQKACSLKDLKPWFIVNKLKIDN